MVSAIMMFGLFFDVLLKAFSISSKLWPSIVCTPHHKASKTISNFFKSIISFVAQSPCCLFLSTITTKFVNFFCGANRNHSHTDPSFISPSPTTTKIFLSLSDNAIPIHIESPCHKDPAVASTHSIVHKVTCHHNFWPF
jgi:hypothetical protein